MRKLFVLLAVSIMLVGAFSISVTANEHKSNNGGGGGGGGGGGDATLGVVNADQCGQVIDIGMGNHYFNPGSHHLGFGTADITVDSTLDAGNGDYVDCFRFFNEGGNHDGTYTIGGHGTEIIAKCDISGKKSCYMDMSYVARTLGLKSNDIVSKTIHCHQHEAQDMMGTTIITVI